ncbi:NUDIX domain-containing protein [Hydrobacter penzbergensis]|uniref:NUDIX domain-containing protein n=1 Tax=Hydrobacter penzbergensis TaxID=1235997 RepID=A0A8X8LDU9_9BACT|nr:NUDIX domain-containing protein [Hydrobacter penzbergensis]SDX00774.1 NUDIX domain-containing protein [Hydrobacter penzbergensis]
MRALKSIREFIEEGGKLFHPGISLDCVIFGFHDNQLKVLLLKMEHTDDWALPGGFVYKEEDLEAAATRVLQERTGINNIFLQQFHVFGNPSRSDREYQSNWLRKWNIPAGKGSWLLNRFVTVGFYALVEFSHVTPTPDNISVASEWHHLHNIDNLFMDHRKILDTALETLRWQLNHQPIGYNLLPDKFTMPELLTLYETILGKKLDRRNFRRRMNSYGILRKLKEKRKGCAHKAPYLYSFDLRKYQKALQEGLQGRW